MKIMKMKSNEFDYYDAEDNTVVMWFDKTKDLVIYTELIIDDTEFSGNMWDCYLKVAEYDAKAQAYRCEYKAY